MSGLCTVTATKKIKMLLMVAVSITLSFIYSSNVMASTQSMQSDIKNEQVKQIQDSKIKQRYGHWLFNGSFKEQAFSAVNPHYQISQGDQLMVQLWGGIDFQAQMTVDPQGNIFIPKVGPVSVLGVTNKALNNVVLNSVKRVYKSNVQAYVSLMSSQQVKVFLSGMVTNPGLYKGQSADSILRFIDLAGGIRNDIGSYRNVQVKRASKIVQSIDLYQFLLQGTMPPLQLQDGDVIFVAAKQDEVSIEGEVGFQGRFELAGKTISLKNILAAAVALEKATHVTVISPVFTAGKSYNSSEPLQNRIVQAKQYAIEDTDLITLTAGSVIKVSSQVRADSISISLIGEHNSAQEMVLPWGASLADLLAVVNMTTLSNSEAVQLFRDSIAQRQFDMLQASLTTLEQTVLTARSNTKEAAQLRQAEADVILQWISKARQVQPKGQVLLIAGFNPSNIILQQDDKIVIPIKRNLVMVHGEVLFPTAIAYNNGLSIEEFISHAGGATDDLDEFNILVKRANGSFVDVNELLTKNNAIQPGDEIFVLAKPDFKGFQLAKDITEIIYQVAMSAAVVIAL